MDPLFKHHPTHVKNILESEFAAAAHTMYMAQQPQLHVQWRVNDGFVELITTDPDSAG